MSRWIGIFGVLCGLLHCGGAHDLAPTESSALYGTQLIIQQPKGVTDHPLAAIVEYRITITAADMEPWTLAVDPSAITGPITGVPAGANRRMIIEARNARGDIIRRGVAENVTIPAAQLATVTVALAVVPIFTNLPADTVEFNTRFRPEVLSAPERTIRVLQGTTDPNTPLFDLAVGANLIPIPEAGIVRGHFAPLSPGTYHLVVEDVESGESSRVTVRLLDGSSAQATPWLSAGLIDADHQLRMGGL